jgi:hypothetical protein
MNKRKHKGPSHTRRKQLRFGLQQQRLAQAKAKATELELRLKDWETVVVELLHQHRESETEILDLRATIEQGFGREGGGLPNLAQPLNTYVADVLLPMSHSVRARAQVREHLRSRCRDPETQLSHASTSIP